MGWQYVLGFFDISSQVDAVLFLVVTAVLL
jgi:hypothetical protein